MQPIGWTQSRDRGCCWEQLVLSGGLWEDADLYVRVKRRLSYTHDKVRTLVCGPKGNRELVFWGRALEALEERGPCHLTSSSG